MKKFVESAYVPYREVMLQHNICVYVDFMLDRVAPGQVLLNVLRFSPVIIIPSFFHTHINSSVTGATDSLVK